MDKTKNLIWEDLTDEEIICLLDELRDYVKAKDRPRAFNIISVAMERIRSTQIAPQEPEKKYVCSTIDLEHIRATSYKPQMPERVYHCGSYQTQK